MAWTIKETASITGISADTLRYYDKLGIVSPKRQDNEYRFYEEKDLFALQYISVMKYAQFSLAEIKTIVNLLDKEPSPGCNAIGIEILQAKKAELTQMVQNYQNILKLIQELLPMMDGADVFQANKKEINDFVLQIFHDIQ